MNTDLKLFFVLSRVMGFLMLTQSPTLFGSARLPDVNVDDLNYLPELVCWAA